MADGHGPRGSVDCDDLSGLDLLCGDWDAVSLRHVATEAGVSTGMVQHYFRTQDEMRPSAGEMVMTNTQARAPADPAPFRAGRISTAQATTDTALRVDP